MICSKCKNDKPIGEFNKGQYWCKDCRKQYFAEWRIKNPEYYKNYHKESMVNNPSEVVNTNYIKEWKAKHPGYDREWMLKNPEKYKNYRIKSRLKNPEYGRITHIKVTHNKRCPGKLDYDAFLQKYIDLGKICFYCKKPLPIIELCIDHDIPAGHGGTNDINNLLPACRSCNSKKRNKTAEEFLSS